MLNRKIRIAAWGIILALAIFQAYANRYAISPDGMSYLDLSDAVVKGKWGELVNLYWSPLYPFLIGVARAASGAGPAGEVAAMHLVGVLCFAALFAAFDYFLIQVFSMAARTRGASLRGAWGTACAYALFGAVAITLTPLELTTPDLLSNAATFVALGAMLRLVDDTRPADSRRRDAVLLGAALGLGVLAKSFLVPWSILCFAVLGFALRRRGPTLRIRTSLRPLGVAMVAWAVFVLPWTAILSARAGRLTFGDAGRLTYAWYVNNQDAPSMRLVPSGARNADTDLILPGVGITGDAPGTDPMWFDPARWNAGVKPHFVLSEQLATIKVMSVALFGSISVLAYVIFLVATAPDGTRRRGWRQGWVVFVPCLAGIFAYLMVILTARYIMAFVLASILVVLATFPVARRVRPMHVLLGIVLTMATMLISRATAYGLSFVVAIAGAMLIGTMVPIRKHITWLVAVPLSLGLGVIMFSPVVPAFTRLAGGAIALLLWTRSIAAIRKHRTETFAFSMNVALALSIALVLAGRVALRISRDLSSLDRAASPVSSNADWKIAQDLKAHGVTPGTRIALIGPHAESYWARTARLKIVANVPDPLVQFWYFIPSASRDSLMAKFAQHGASVAIVTRPPPGGVQDSTWIPLRYQGWMKRLK